MSQPFYFYIVKAMVFPEVMYGCESWAVKKAEHQRSAFSDNFLDKYNLSKSTSVETESLNV